MSKEAAAQSESAAATTTEQAGFLDQIIKATKPRSDTQIETAKRTLQEFVGKLMEPGAVVSKDVEKTINFWIAEIDKKISAQLNEIMHTEEFQKLEASWRGLFYLVDKTETSTSLKIRVLNASKKDLLKDLEKASEFDQSGLFIRFTKPNTASSAASPTAS